METKQQEASAATGTSRKLEGKIALITGANSGIGLATAKRFVAEDETPLRRWKAGR